MNAPAGYCLDLTRLVGRAAISRSTGIDRVERAYLRAILDQADLDIFGLIAVRRELMLLDRRGLQAFAKLSDANGPWDEPTLLDRLRRANPSFLGAQATIRRLAIASCRRGEQHRILPRGVGYFNTGHSNLDRDTLRGFGDALRAVFVHDTIPLDHPEFQKPGQPERFEQRMKAVSELADVVIVPSKAVAKDVDRWFSEFGRVPEVVVAPLGIDPPVVDAHTPARQPYFVSVGTIEPRKNHLLLLKLWGALQDEMPASAIAHLHLVGRRGWRNEEVFSILDTHPIIGTTVFEHSNMDDQSLSNLISGARGLLHPSFAEGFGLPPHEALVRGVVPVIAPLDAYKETIGDAAIYADPADLYQWRRAIADLAGDGGAQAKGEVPASYAAPTWAEHFNIALSVFR